MGNFLVVIPAKGASANAAEVFRNGLYAARKIRAQTPAYCAETDWALAASFTRQNGSGGTLVTDPSTQSWLLSCGTWFHSEGYSSGAEVRLLRRYLDSDSTRLARELEGFFVLVLGDARTREVLVLTDIVGSCHCFQRSFAAASVLSGSSLLLTSLETCRLDSVACQEFLYTGITYEDRTCYQEVRKLSPATVFRFADGKKISEQRYWRATDVKPESLRGETAVDMLWEAATRVAKKIRALYANPICDLTGGYDSRALVAAFLGANVRCATVVFGPDDSADVRISSELAKALDLRHIHNRPLRQISFEQVEACVALTDGEYDIVDYAQIQEIHRGLSQTFDISINGSFGEVARGYWWELLFPRIGARGPLNSRKVAECRYAAQQFEPSIIPPEQRLDLVDHFSEVIERTNAGLFELPNTFQMDHAYLMMRMQRWQGRIASSTNQIWPCLSPFMFRSVIEIMLRARAMLRWRGLLIRKMLARFSPQMANHPLEHGFPAESANWRNFYRFLPLTSYFGAKIASKLGLLRRRSGYDGTHARLQLWSEQQVKGLLRSSSMELAGSLDSAALANFLIRSQKEEFAFSEQWARILSLECALQTAVRVRRDFEK